MSSLFSKSKTFRPKKGFGKGSKLQQLHKFAKATLGSGNLREAVVLPTGEDLNEWLAVNTVDFFNQVNLLYGSVMEYCTDETCPIMSAGPTVEYMWADGKDIKKPVKVSAPQYVDYLMTWIQATLDDDAVFPSRIDTPFPKTFSTVVKNIFRRLFRVYAHIYHSHFDRIRSLGEEAHLNTCFKHFAYFVKEFSLIPDKELEPLEELMNELFARDSGVPVSERAATDEASYAAAQDGSEEEDD